MKVQELLNGDFRVDPPEAGKPRAARVNVERFSLFEQELKDIEKHYDDHTTYLALRRVWAAWDKFKGIRR